MNGKNNKNKPSAPQQPEYDGQPYYDENGQLHFPGIENNENAPSSGTDPYKQEYLRQLEEFNKLSGTSYEDNQDIDMQFHPINEIYQQQNFDEPQKQKVSKSGGSSGNNTSKRKPPQKTSASAAKSKSANASKSSNKSDKTKKQKSNSYKPSGKYNSQNLQFGSNSPNKSKNKKGSGKVNGKNYNEAEKSHPIRTFFMIVILLVILLFLAFNLILWKYISLVNVKEDSQRTVTNASMSSSNVKNILIIGSDTREEGVNGRTDSMIILSINKSSKEITMTSLMRDMYVEIVGVNSQGESVDFWDKLNSAYVYGGAELLMDTIAYNFDIAVDDYVYIDFYSFVDIVDSLGGIEIEISDEEADGMTAPMAEQNKILGNEKGTDYLTHGGTILMNGNQALAYARLRYVGNADFERTQRQRLVIEKIIEKAKQSDISTINDFAKATLSNLTTNMTKPQMLLMVYKMAFSLNYEMNSLRIPDDNSYSYGTTSNGQSILQVDFERCKQLLQSEIYK